MSTKTEFESVNQRLCQTQANAEIKELLQGLKDRFSKLEVEDPKSVTADNCCSIRSAIDPVFAQTAVHLDLYHMVGRYARCAALGISALYLTVT